jgi:hypothetical protein
VGIPFLITATYQGQCQTIRPRKKTRWKEWQRKEENKKENRRMEVKIEREYKIIH